ncbi:MAG: TPR repeat protein [Crocinitomicaceae bacterium]|jgi:TPR repeat protein
MAKYDDVSWHFDGAKFPKGEPIELGATHIGMFFKWCVINDLITEEHAQRNPEELEQVRNGQLSGRDFVMDFCDGVLGSDDLTETGNRFAEDYYNDNTDFGKKCAEYSGDYCRAIDQGREHGEIYEFEDNPFNFDAVNGIVDHRFNEWKVFDVVRDLKQFKKNENLEDAENQYALGQFYTIGYPTSADKKTAYEWFQKSADQDHKEAEYRVGLCHFKSQGAKFDQALGCEWFLKSAEQGVAIACFYLGQAYHYGDGKDVDKLEAAVWYTKALAGGVIGAQYQLDYINGKV